MRFSSFFSFAAAVGAAFSLTSDLALVTEDFGENPTNVPFYIYVPKTVTHHPAVLVAAHWCTGTGIDFFNYTDYATYSDQFGYIVIYPSAPRESKCWDVASNETLTHNGGSDSLAVVNMVKWTLKKYNGDPERVFITGLSSGGMFTQVMMGAYPDVFRGGSAYADVPYGCFRGPTEWNTECAQGQLIKTPKQWGDDVRNAYPGYRGPRPKLQVWHGTLDDGLLYQNLIESNKMWTNVFGIHWRKNNTDTPIANYTQMIFGDGTQYQAISCFGVPHNVPIRALDTLEWFGIYKPPKSISTKPITTTKAVTTKTTTAVVATTTSGGAAHYAQCGGLTYKGPTTCAGGWKCVKINDYLWQCLP